ncbi:MAG: hypothetical protein K5945_06730, partial [Bacteroidaceae bacterium]|nr:hypothetical protein [Bacteroidaceae bacterium]
MKKMFSFLLLMLTTLGMQAQSWRGTEPIVGDGNSYNHETVVYATLTSNLASPSLNIAAFIGDECRASVYPDVGTEATGAPTTASGNNYTIRVAGDKSADMGKTITFKVFDPDSGLEYTLGTTLQFDGETHGEPSNPIVLTLTVPTSYTLTLKEVEVGQSYILKNYVTVDEGATMPDNLVWRVTYGDSGDASNYAKIDNNTKLTGVSPCTGLMLSLMSTAGTGMPLATCMFDVVQYATGINLIQTYLKVNKNDNGAVSAFMQPGVSYKLVPEGSSDEVKWETEDQQGSILRWSDEAGYYEPIGSGTTKIRPYVNKKDGSKLYPEGWITVTVIVPVDRIYIDKSIFGDTFRANVGDVKLYERMARMIKIFPEDATDKTYEITVDEGSSNLITKTGNTTFTAKAKGTATVTVKANGANSAATDGGSVTAQITVEILSPTTEAIIAQNSITTSLQDGIATDITPLVQGNVQLNGDGSNFENCSVNVSGTSVRADGAAISMSGLTGTYTAVAEGTTTFTINLSWPNYDEWGVSADALQYKSSTAQFKVVVTNQTTLLGFDVAVTNAVAGKTGTLTLTPVPAGATFDPNDITVKMVNGLDGEWGALLTTTKKSATQSQIVYEFTSQIPCYVYVNALESGTNRIKLNDQSATTTPEDEYLLRFEIAYPLSLAQGWQWRSNPVGIVTPADFATIYANVTEIRTRNDLLYNDSQWGLFGTLNNTAGIKQAQCYKIKMKVAQESLLYGSSVTDMNNIDGSATAEGTITVTLKPGWNWVGSPYLFDRKLANIIGSSYANTLGDGAVIVGKTGSAEYKNGAWNGDLTVLKSGEGYLIKNPTTAAVELVFASEMNMSPQNEMVAGVKSALMAGRVWQYDHTRFMDNMTMVAV